MAEIEFAGYLRDNAGTPIAGATVELFAVGDATTVHKNTTTNAAGLWAMTQLSEGTFDVKITSGGSVRYQQYATSIQMTELEVKKLQLRNNAGTFTIDLTPGAVSANRVLNVPVITGTDTLATLGLAATYTAIMTHSADLVLQDAVALWLGSSGDARLRWSAADSSNPALVLALGNTSRALHITELADQGTDWDVSAADDPTIFIHSDTTPITDYLRIGGHDGTTAYIDVVGGTTIAFQAGGTTEATISTSGLTLPAGSDLIFSGTTGTNDINLTDSVADALSIVRGSTDMVVFDSNTPAITITPATTITGLITSAGGITFGANADIAMTGTTGTNDFVLTNGLADALSITDGAADVLVIDTSTTGNVMTFTSAFTVSGLVSVDDPTDSTSTTTGSIHTDGGLGIAKDLYVGNDILIATGGVINFAGGDVTLTHASNTMTVGGGDLLIANGFGAVIGHTAKVAAWGTAQFQILGTGAGGTDASMVIGSWSDRAGNDASPTIQFVRSLNTTIGSKTVVTDNAILGQVLFIGDDGVDFTTIAADMQVRVDMGTPAENDVGAEFVWRLAADGVALREVAVLDSLGALSWKVSKDSASVADQVSIGRYEIGGGNTVLAISQETAVATDTDETKFSHKMQVRINGATYYMMLTAT
jgi:hypothetical protein